MMKNKENNELLRIKGVAELTTLSRSYIYQLSRQGKFPKPKKLTKNTSVWVKSEVLAWVDNAISKTKQGI